MVASVVAIARLSGAIEVPGYAATIMVIAFFAALNLGGLGIIGAYVWRTFENTKGRPEAIVMADSSHASRSGRGAMSVEVDPRASCESSDVGEGTSDRPLQPCGGRGQCSAATA